MRGYNSIDKLTWDECQALLSTENSPERLEAIQERLEILAKEIKIKDDNAFSSCKTLKDFKDYITAYPNGTHVGKAKDKIKLLEKQQEEKLFSSAKTIAEYEEYISKYPYGAFAREASLRIDDLFFAINSGTKVKCERYLAKYPNGRHKQEAVAMINKANRNRVIFVVAIIIAIILFLIGYDPSGQVVFGSITNSDCEVNKTVTVAFNSPRMLTVPLMLIAQSSYNKNLSFPKEGGRQEVSFSSGASSENVEVNSSSSWISAKKVAGGKIVINVSKNEGPERSGTVEVKAYSTLFGVRTGSNSSTIYVKQSTGHASYINVSYDDITFDQYGGSKNITVTSDGYWSIGESIASWGHLSINGNTISIRVDSNSSKDRSDYFTIKSGSTTRRIDVSQAGKQASFLNPSQTNISVSHSGGTRTITVTTDGTWEFGTDTESWIDLSRSGNTITLDISSYSGSSDRSDYFTIKSGNLEKRINITQTADNTPRAEVNRVWVEHNIQRTGYNSVYNAYWGWQQVPYNYYVMRIHVDFDVDNMKGKTIRVCAFFYDEDGDEMTTSNNQYRAPDGQVTVQKTATPGYKNTNYSDVALEIPTSVMRKGSNKFHIQIQDSRGNTLTTSSYEYFKVN